MTNACLSGVGEYQDLITADRAVSGFMTGGFTGSIHTCVDHAIDGWSQWGIPMVFRIGDTANATPFGATTGASAADMITFNEWDDEKPWDTFNNGDDIGNLKTVNLGQVRAMKSLYETANPLICVLFTSSEYFQSSVFFCMESDATSGGTLDDLDAASIFSIASETDDIMNRTNFGSVWNFWPYLAANTSGADLRVQTADFMMFVGSKTGTGVVTRNTFVPAATPTLTDFETTSTWTQATSGVTTASTYYVYIDPPANGMAQFKGLTNSATEKTYLQVVCLGVAPVYATWAININGTTDTTGFIVNCYTGIPQCASSLADGLTYLNTASATTVAATCMADPRYLTWRSFVLKMQYDGTVNWYRIDSYYNSAAKAAASTWGPGIVLSTNPFSNDDNAGTGSSVIGLTFCFAYSDGSGVQLNHIAAGTAPHASNSTAGTGTNTLTSAPTSFSNVLPGVPASYAENLCLSSDLLLTGTTDTSTLDSTITAYSDGYKAKISLDLE
jgi:hypothetical protein